LTVEVRCFNTARVFAESGVRIAIVDPPVPLYRRRSSLEIQPFEPATQVSVSVVRSRKRPFSRGAEAVSCQVRLVAAAINEKLVLSSPFGRAEYLQGK